LGRVQQRVSSLLSSCILTFLCRSFRTNTDVCKVYEGGSNKEEDIYVTETIEGGVNKEEEIYIRETIEGGANKN